MERRRLLGALGLALASFGALRLVDGARIADEGEGLALRWVRALAEHPVRTPLALFVLAWACLPSGREGVRKREERASERPRARLGGDLRL